MKLTRLILLAVILTGAGCGQKGPLVLPDAQHPRKKVKLPAIPKPASTPASPSAEPSIPSGPAPNPAPPEAAPDSNSSPNPAPQG
jgi:predicted small lipoprotein YifL